MAPPGGAATAHKVKLRQRWAAECQAFVPSENWLLRLADDDEKEWVQSNLFADKDIENYWMLSMCSHHCTYSLVADATL
jgi:hypothetical protein